MNNYYIPTWDESVEIKLQMFDHTVGREAHSQELAQIMRQIVNTVGSSLKESEKNEQLYAIIKNLGHTSSRMLNQEAYWFPYNMLELLVRKQKDYGHGNIQAFGVLGVAVRICDKIARYFNLVNRQDDAQNEPFIDCLVDMVGYSVIALMLKDDTFKLELKDDNDTAKL